MPAFYEAMPHGESADEKLKVDKNDNIAQSLVKKKANNLLAIKQK